MRLMVTLKDSHDRDLHHWDLEITGISIADQNTESAKHDVEIAMTDLLRMWGMAPEDMGTHVRYRSYPHCTAS